MVLDSYAKTSRRGRSIPQTTMVDIQTETNHRGELSALDLAAVASISQELNHLGVIRPVETMRGITSQEELAAVLADAESRSLSEEDLNSDYHIAHLDEVLSEREGVSNPLMEKFEDYEGLDYNPAFRARDALEGLLEGSKSRNKKRRTL